MTDPNVLVAVDGDSTSYDALEFALDRALQTDDTLHIVTVGLLKDETEHIIDEIHDTVDGTPVDCKIEAIYEEDPKTDLSVKDELLSLIRENDYEFVVLGNKDESLFYRLFIGSVSKSIIDTHEVPVLLVPELK